MALPWPFRLSSREKSIVRDLAESERAIEAENASNGAIAIRLCRPQERLVLALLAAGYGHDEISERTGLTPRQSRKRAQRGRHGARLYLTALETGGECGPALRAIAAGRSPSAVHLQSCDLCRSAGGDPSK